MSQNQHDREGKCCDNPKVEKTTGGGAVKPIYSCENCGTVKNNEGMEERFDEIFGQDSTGEKVSGWLFAVPDRLYPNNKIGEGFTKIANQGDIKSFIQSELAFAVSTAVREEQNRIVGVVEGLIPDIGILAAANISSGAREYINGYEKAKSEVLAKIKGEGR